MRHVRRVETEELGNTTRVIVFKILQALSSADTDIFENAFTAITEAYHDFHVNVLTIRGRVGSCLMEELKKIKNAQNPRHTLLFLA